MTRIKYFEGHSGCSIELRKKDDKYFVRKLSKNIEYNQRLEKQFLKQLEYEGPFQKPETYRNGYLNELFYFDMEYIKGSTLASKLAYLNKYELDHYAEIIQTLDSFESDSINITEKINSKLAELESKISDADMLEIIEYLRHVRWRSQKIGSIHGDLTMENIIISNQEIYLIDFLDSFLDSPLVDSSKFVMDLIINWSKRNEPSVEALINSSYILKKILKHNSNALDILNMGLLHIIRIVPYTNSYENLSRLKYGVKRIEAIIKEITT